MEISRHQERNRARPRAAWPSRPGADRRRPRRSARPRRMRAPARARRAGTRPMNIASLFVRAGRADAGRPALALGADVTLTYGELVAARRRDRRAAALAARAAAGRSGRAGDEEPARLRRAAARRLVRRPDHGAGQRQAAPARVRLHSRSFRRQGVLRERGSGRGGGAGRGRARRRGAGDRGRQPGASSAAAGRPGADRRGRARTTSAWLFYTSGTTGRPKGAMLSHGNLLAMTLSYFADVDQIGPGDAIVHAAPMSHGSGCYILPHAARAACQVVPASGGFDPAEIFALCRAHRGVTLFAAPTMVKRLAEHPRPGSSDHPGLKTIVYGGGPMYLADLEQAHAVFGHRLAQIYGQGESPMCITALDKARHADRAHPRYRERLASVGTRAAGGRGDGRGRRRPAAAGGRARRGAGARRQRDAGLLARSRGDRGDAEGRLAAHRRCRRDGRRRLPVAARSLEGPDHLGRRQHLSARDRGGAPATSGGGGSRGRRPGRPGMGRDRGRLRGAGRRPARSPRPTSMPTAWRRSPASSGRRTIASSPRCPRTTTARCSRPSCGPGSSKADRHAP